ncbi:MAG: hypothetical protein ACK4MV_18130 [Beijerinckiaceae bacterium]
MPAVSMSVLRGAFALALSITLMAIPALAQSGRAPAGFITAVEAPEREGRPTAILKRAGQPVDLQIWTSLFDGDVLEVADGAVTIETARDKRVVIDAARSPHHIEGELPTAGRFSAVASVIGDLFRQKPSRNSAGLIGRTGAPEIRIGGGAVQKVVSGQPLWVAWVGGSSPYEIEIRGQSEQRKRNIQILAAQKSEGDAALLTLPRSASGNLTLIVRDAAGREAKRSLQTIPAPKFPAWIGAGSPTPEFEQVARAIYLLDDKTRGMDMLAATIAAQAGEYPAAVNLRTILGDGRRPE